MNMNLMNCWICAIFASLLWLDLFSRIDSRASKFEESFFFCWFRSSNGNHILSCDLWRVWRKWKWRKCGC
jgi:hypothetical protein